MRQCTQHEIDIFNILFMHNIHHHVPFHMRFSTLSLHHAASPFTLTLMNHFTCRTHYTALHLLEEQNSTVKVQMGRGSVTSVLSRSVPEGAGKNRDTRVSMANVRTDT